MKAKGEEQNKHDTTSEFLNNGEENAREKSTRRKLQNRTQRTRP
jgi:hypothetical protein